MNSRLFLRLLAGAVPCAALLLLSGVTQCNSTCSELDSEGNRISFACAICDNPDTNPCTVDSWTLPGGATCVEDDQPVVSNGTACDDGTVSGVCFDGVCSDSVPCATTVAAAAQSCLSDINAVWADCYADGDAPCLPDEPEISAALDSLETSVRASCADGEFQALGVDALVSRLQVSCTSEAASLASRSFGGPQGAVWGTADGATQACLQSAHASASALLDDVVSTTNACLASGGCDAVQRDADVQSLAQAATAEVAAACGVFESVVALSAAQYVDRALKQADCTVAMSNDDTAPLALSCGPARAGATPPRGEYIQVVLDEAEWGTRCGDGSPFAFQIRLAPEGFPIDRVLIGMQGGGVCLLDDCNNAWNNSPGLFESLSDQAPTSGIMSNDPAVNPFANWTKVYLPYCNQDVFAGGGTPQFINPITVERYGSVNVRAALEYVRNVMWRVLDEEGGAGYRPDEVVAAFGGWSAGGFGALYNYHWVLDDLQWPQTTAFADASLALDNGDPGFGLRTLGGLLSLIWNATSVFPPYCFAGDCALGPELYAASAPRLKAVPNQQFLILTNQNDSTQVNTTFFSSTPQWINEARSSVCDTKDLNGIQYYLTSVVNSVHVVSLGGLYGGSVDGVFMSDWLWDGVIGAPDGITDRIEEGNFVEAIPGVNPFPCAVAP